VNAAVDDLGRLGLGARDEPMSRHTSWRVGGPADVFFRPRGTAELKAILGSLPADMPITWIGLGSNMLVRDGGIRGAVIATGGLDREIVRLDTTRVRAGAGATCARLARKCVEWHLGPAAYLAGIPGTVGGALRMNAGAFGGETWDRVESVATIDRSGHVRERPKSDFDIGYRSVRGVENEWFVSASFAFDEEATVGPDTIKSLLAKRAQSQPTGAASCGSVFRNPAGSAAGKLIERAGLKGHRIGGAVVSEKHANFIINDGSASAADIEALIEHIIGVVERFAGVRLEPEVLIVGEPAEGRP